MFHLVLLSAKFLSTPSARRATYAGKLIDQRQAEFLSTPSARRATDNAAAQHNQQGDFYPRPPRGGRRYTSASHWRDIDISIHALREEGDASDTGRKTKDGKFLSTPSARRATERAVVS